METIKKYFYLLSCDQIKSFFNFAEGQEVKTTLQNVCPGHYTHPLYQHKHK